jgi:hypothetical protein
MTDQSNLAVHLFNKLVLSGTICWLLGSENEHNKPRLKSIYDSLKIVEDVQQNVDLLSIHNT